MNKAIVMAVPGPIGRHNIRWAILHSTLGFGEPDFGMTHSSILSGLYSGMYQHPPSPPPPPPPHTHLSAVFNAQSVSLIPFSPSHTLCPPGSSSSPPPPPQKTNKQQQPNFLHWVVVLSSARLNENICSQSLRVLS